MGAVLDARRRSLIASLARSRVPTIAHRARRDLRVAGAENYVQIGDEDRDLAALQRERQDSRRPSVPYVAGSPRALQEVDLLLLAHDHVLESMLERLGTSLATGWLDRRL